MPKVRQRHRVQVVGAQHRAVGVVRPLANDAGRAAGLTKVTKRDQVAAGVHDRPPRVTRAVVLHEQLVKTPIARPPDILPRQVRRRSAPADLVLLVLGLRALVAVADDGIDDDFLDAPYAVVIEAFGAEVVVGNRAGPGVGRRKPQRSANQDDQSQECVSLQSSVLSEAIKSCMLSATK